MSEEDSSRRNRYIWISFSVIGSVTVALLIVCIALCCRKRHIQNERKKKESKKKNTKPKSHQPSQKKLGQKEQVIFDISNKKSSDDNSSKRTNENPKETTGLINSKIKLENSNDNDATGV